ncbi:MULTISPECIES: hypothetical protein [unclassified Streptomyces]|uniref:hypothetical protein n=1 Tax=unclassified Streptomyces TaxID=2593676 RepID=UPI001385E212|nr:MULTISPECIES: hypothetical protein [unclassified Streptomyces]MYQ82952.1 hypothetical protein [Streptomyces sp. SID4936]
MRRVSAPFALIRPKPDLDLVAAEPAEAVAAAQAAVDAPDGALTRRMVGPDHESA